ncbi:SusC/RagA family TonB-linked outer membrane protein [Chitinophaga oryziterrae]|uniref:SusC/RagA family TonB-linked outer membrane protein n=2 Tax=Chitinophaga oryziterrae TaxID=1031224 RepID=A0A6N8JCY5_9BACT|nr:SusC/RagA family TonB-linked outer membrane protein [Chitinophaga oryziterrae]
MKPTFLNRGRDIRMLLPAKIRLTMKLTFLILFAACLQVSASSYAQKITLSEKNASLEKIFRVIKAQTGYLFLFDDQQLQSARKVTIEVKEASIQTVLDQCFQDQPLAYRIVDKTIIVQPKGIVKKGPPFVIRGVVTDDEGPLEHVTVQVEGKGIGMTTNAKGEYDLTDPNVDEETILIFSFIGYVPQKIRIGNRHTLNVKLVRDRKVLDETVIIGYGTTTQRKSTGAISSITSKEIATQTIDNPLTALQGHIPGVQITQDNGLPGAGVRVQIRGQNTAAAGFIPLYVIDGVPFTLFNGGQPTTDALNAYGTSGANGNISPFSMIAPEDIERIDILKDADATAIYGSRGANGVILITTKKGRKGKTSLNINVSNGIANVNRYIPMMNTQEYLQMRKDAFAHSGVTPTTTNAKDLLVWDQNAYTDWQKWAIGGTAHYTNAAVSVSGGDAQNTFLFSSDYRKQGTVFPGDFDNSSLSGRLNAGHRSLDDRFNMNVGVNYSYAKNNLPQTDLSSLYDLPPNYPIYNADNSLNWTRTNPLSYLKKKYNGQTTNFISSADISYKILSNLTVKANLGFTQTILKQTVAIPASSQNIAATATPAVIAAANNLSSANNGNDNYIVEPQIEYTTGIKGGKLQLLAGTTFQQSKATGISLYGSNFSSESLLNSISSAGTITVRSNNYSVYKYNAVFARANYNWQDKYIVDGTFRRDGSSRFGPNHRFGNFGAVGAAWLFSKEKFMADIPVISFGKLRGSYGLTGNDQIPNYLYSALYTSAWTGYNYLGTNTLVQNNISNPDLHWETTKKLDFALELGLWNDRILLKTDFYRNRSSDQLVYIALPTQSGFVNYTGNFPALIQNKGWEFEVTTTNIQSKSVKWTTSLNVTINRNKLISFPNLATSSYSTTYVIGQPIDVQLLYHYTGVDPTTGSPTFTSKGATPQYATDRVPMNVGHPYYGGITNNISYKNFTLDFTFQFNHRNGFKNSTLTSNFYPYGYGYTNQSTAILDRWKTTGDKAFFPSAGANYDQAYSNLASSDYNWGDASFIKFKTLSLTYNLPKTWLQHVHMSGASLYAQGQNLYTWAKQKYAYDPETTLPGTGPGLGTGRYSAFPQLRTMVVGLNLSF